MKLTEVDFKQAAQQLECEVAAIKAVAKVEAAGSATFPDGRPKILFEAHIFSDLTGGEYDKSHPKVSSDHWNRNLYIGGPGEYSRLEAACSLNRMAALQATSWGMFQILGKNYRACGFGSVEQFVTAMYAGEQAQLRAFVNFIISQGIAEALRKKNWKLFARKYNGPAFYKNNYDIKLEQAYKSFIH